MLHFRVLFPGEIWKTLRKLLTGIFSTGKLKAMLPPLMTVSNKNLDYLEKEVAKNPVLNVKPIIQGKGGILFSIFWPHFNCI